MSASTLSSAGGLVFDVDQRTGAVTVVGRVDREANPVYRLLISAKDRGPDPTSADAIVLVRVTDANDNSPQISINTLLQASNKQ